MRGHISYLCPRLECEFVLANANDEADESQTVKLRRIYSGQDDSMRSFLASKLVVNVNQRCDSSNTVF